MLFRRIHIKQYYSLIKYDQLDSFEIKYGKRKVDIFMAKNDFFQTIILIQMSKVLIWVKASLPL